MESNYYKIPKSRRIKDFILNFVTGSSSFISVVILLSIIVFVLIFGLRNFSFKMITSNYYETPFFLTCEERIGYELSKEDENDVYYSRKFGIGLKDSVDLEGNDCVVISYIDDNSPLKNAKSALNGELIEIKTGQIVKRLQLSNGDDFKVVTTKAGSYNMVKELDNSKVINELYYTTMGGGIRGSLITTLILIISTLIISMPIGIIAAIYLSVYAKKNRVTEILRSLIDMISGVPSIIFGLIGIIVFIPFVSTFSRNNGGSILSGALTMSIMLLPIIIKTTEESINEIPKGYKLSSLALGASETQTTLKVILPNAIPGILTSILLSVGRIVGESAALIFAIGTAIQDKVSLFGSSTTLAVHIWTVMSGENPNYEMACAISLIILVLVFIMNILVKLVVKKMNKFEVK